MFALSKERKKERSVCCLWNKQVQSVCCLWNKQVQFGEMGEWHIPKSKSKCRGLRCRYHRCNANH